MNPDKINPGDKGCDPVNRLFCWHNDMVNDLHNDNALWFWVAKCYGPRPGLRQISLQERIATIDTSGALCRFGTEGRDQELAYKGT